MKNVLKFLTVAGLVTTAAPAFATTIDVDKANSSIFGDAAGQNKWSVITKFEVNGNASGGVYAGAFRLKSDQAGDLAEFLAFCLQPLETLNLGIDYQLGSNFTAAVNKNLNILAANAWNLVTDATSAGAFQMAAWEITTETAQGFDIDSGTFKIISNRADSNAAEAQANAWLGEINNDIWTSNGQEFIILNAAGTQDLLTNVSPVPLPASGLLLLGGLAGAGAMARRKARKA